MNKAQFEKAKKLANRSYNISLSLDKLSDGSKIYMARNPELPGCKAQGKTPTEAITSLRDARIDYIYFLLEDGLDVPFPHGQLSMTSSQVVIPDTKQFESISTIEDEVVSPEKRDDLHETWSISEPVGN